MKVLFNLIAAYSDNSTLSQNKLCIYVVKLLITNKTTFCRFYLLI